MIEIENLYFSYENKDILKNINLSVKEGEFIGIMGANGSGKSTLIKNILGILKHQKGNIKIYNKYIQSYSHKELGKIFGFLPQNSNLKMPLKVKEVLYMGLYCDLKNPLFGFNKIDKEKIDKISQELDIAHLNERVALSLSGGEFQRVLLGRALISNPKILLLDEPTSALDINHSIQIMKICEKLCKNQKVSIIGIFHDLNLASLFCNRIVFIKNGEILYNGIIKELFTPKILKEIYDFDCETITHKNKIFVTINKE